MARTSIRLHSLRTKTHTRPGGTGTPTSIDNFEPRDKNRKSLHRIVRRSGDLKLVTTGSPMCTGELMNKQSNESPWSRLVRVPDGGYLVTTLINSKLASIIVPIAAAVTF